MKRLDYYMVLWVLLIVGLWLLYMGQDVYAGLFIGLFIAKAENLLWVEHKETAQIAKELHSMPDFENELDSHEIEKIVNKL